MFGKAIKLFFLFVYFGITNISAQQTYVRVYDYNDIITTLDSYFDKQSFNPSYTGDTLELKASLKRSNYWITVDPEERNFSGLSIERFFDNLSSGIGISYDYKLNVLKSHIIKINYNYRFSLNSIDVRIATSLGLNHYTLNTEYSFINPAEIWNNHPLLSLGILLNYKKHELGITYSEILDFDISPNDWSDPSIFRDHFIVNYNYQFNISESVILTPEIIDYWDFDNNFWILNTSFSFKNRIYAGLFVRSNNEFGYMIGGRPWKWLTIGCSDSRLGLSYSDYQDSYQSLIFTISF